MAKTVNKVFLLGNVGKDPEMKSTSGGTLIANFSIATGSASFTIVAAPSPDITGFTIAQTT